VSGVDFQRTFGDIDIYLFDQLLKGRIRSGDRFLDAGCGSGRNLVYLLHAGLDVRAVDANPHAVAEVRELASRLAPGTPEGHIIHSPNESLPWPDGHVTLVLSSAVLHFARNHDQFGSMVREMWRVLDHGGMFFARLASNIGLEHRVEERGGGRFGLPDGTERYLIDEAGLLEWTRQLGGQLLDPLKTTVVQDQRSMTTWVVRKN
jgi:SAM-dependent methyltransferase